MTVTRITKREIGPILKARLNLCLKQSEVAEQAGIAQSYYSAIESGKRVPSHYVSTKIAQVLDMNPVGLRQVLSDHQQEQAKK